MQPYFDPNRKTTKKNEKWKATFKKKWETTSTKMEDNLKEMNEIRP
jgi:hypothetical protein